MMDSARSRRRMWLVALSVLVVMAIVSVSAPRLWRMIRADRFNEELRAGQNISIPGTSASPGKQISRPQPPAQRIGPGFVTSVSADGRHFVDQYGKPVLVRGDSPWALMTRLSPAQAHIWFADRQRRGFNAAIVSLIGAEANGGPDDSGRTYDGLLPFVDKDILRWNGPYWQRMHDYLELAAEHGITAFLYPIDGWTIGRSFTPTSIPQCQSYGVKVAEYVRDLPNVVWMSGGDYFPGAEDPVRGTDVDRCIEAMMRGIRDTGDNRPFSIQLGDESISTDNPFWATRIDWNFVYTYRPTYQTVLKAYKHEPPIPAVMSEANYEGENNTGGPPTTDETLRRQVLWALTSGSAGDFMGSQDWRFKDGWEDRLDTPAVAQIGRLRDLFAKLPWWQLVPDMDETFVTSGRGVKLTSDEPMDVLDNDYVTAARTHDGRTAVAYVPTERTITIDRAKLATGVAASWVDPVSGARRPAAMSDTFTTPGANAGGDHDWLLLFDTTARGG